MQGIEQIQAELLMLHGEASPLNAANAKLTEYAQDQDKLQRVIESLQVSFEGSFKNKSCA